MYLMLRYAMDDLGYRRMQLSRARPDRRRTAYDISDEALESAAGSEKAGNYTLYFCTALDLCPGP